MPQKRDFYAKGTKEEIWIVRTSLRCITILSAFCAVSLLRSIGTTRADELTPTPAVITFELAGASAIPTPPPLPAPTPAPIEVAEHELNDKDIEWLARLAFLSPLREPEYKAALMWVVLNRVDSRDYPNTIQLVITQRGEFAFWDEDKFIKPENLAENRQLARLVLNQWLSEREGLNAGRLIPREALVIRFTGEGNRGLEVLPDRWGDPLYWPVRGAYEY